ncbi:Serine-aspartate repeat-containing protein D precursor [Stieleria maiorica]|uniref:Serine-aspartate repeat-containing protein D n=1 Tax=Stieleria maiorica TaxID=2795974 RepID=A0A5B9MQI8_9BACT|nr:cadherin-like domain-containing protein [Stieleria maiorica]QEG02501.1 Serine-aspartate repeat-containing protein D precursor [Stieleria maiorica]
MKSLRQLLRRRLHASSAERSQKRRATKHPRGGEMKRRLTTQALEQRQLLAGDLQPAHNYWHGHDVNQDLQITPSDALSVINYLATTSAGASGEQVASSSAEDFAGRKVDVNADGNVTPSDALSVINALARGEQLGELVELMLSARDEDDNLLTVSNGVVQAPGVGIENSFYLEVSYDDLRTFGDDKGAFSVFPDLGVSTGGILQPVLREAQQIVIDSAIRQTQSGFVTVGREGTTDTVDISIGQIQGGFSAALSDALINTFGMPAGSFEITEPTALKGEDGQDLGFEIFYSADQFGNVDIADLTFTPNFDNTVAIDFREFAPLEADGTTPNSAAVRFNLDARSRTLPNNQEFYNLLNRGSFDFATGFTDIGGVGGAFPNGIRDVNGGVMPPTVDVFRIEVFLNAEISDSNPLIIDVNPGEGVDPLTLYGSNDVVTEDLILLDDDARVTISTGAVAVNNPPTVSPVPLEITVSEDDGVSMPSLLTGADDIDGDTLSVDSFNFTGGDTSGVALNGNTVTITPSAYNDLQVGATEVVTATFNIIDGRGGSVSQTLSLTINGANDAPVVSGPISETRSENAETFNVDLLQNASDPDGDTLDAINIAPQAGTGDTSGITVDDAQNRLIVDPSAYAALEDGEQEVIVYDFTVSDGNGGTVMSTVTITINGDTPNSDPVAGDPITLTVSEDDADTTLDLLTNVTDVDPEDTLSVDAATIVTTGDTVGFTVNGNVLSISPAAYNALAASDTETVTYNYDVIDGEGGRVAHSATITINGANDAPEVDAAVSVTVTEDDASTNVDLLDGASDPDNGDSVAVDSLTLRSGDDSGISANGSNGLTIDPSVYNSLPVGQSEVIIYDYNLIDGNGGTTAQSATITITGVNDAPTVGNPIVLTVTEDDSAQSLNLLTGAADPDTGDTLVAESLTFSGSSSAFTLVNDTTLTFDPNFFNGLGATENEVITVNYDVADGNGGTAAQTATITVTGVNDSPVLSGPIDESYSEDAGTQALSLLLGASDPDTNDVLTVENVNVSGDDSGITRNGADLSIDTSAYSSLEEGESVEIVFTYEVTDGTVSLNQTATVTITGGADTPIPGPDISLTLNESDAARTVDLLQGSSDPNGDPLSVTNATIRSGDARGVTIDAANNRLLVDPAAYVDLEDGESEVIIVDYNVSDDNGNSAPRTATVTIIGQTIVPSTISGQLFIDHIENSEAVRGGAAPIRNGVKDADEKGLAGVTIRLHEVTSSGETPVASVLTDMNGAYSFTGIFPGTYVVEYDVPDSVHFTGSTRGRIVISDAGGQSASGPMLDAIGLIGVQQRLDLLAKSYIAAGIIDTSELPEGLGGGSVHLNADGTMKMFVAGEGFDPEFAEVVLNDARDAALLTIIDAVDGKVKSARLNLDQFVVTSDGLGVRFFGGMDDFDFVETSEELVQDEFEDYRNAIDKIIGSEF